MPAIAIVEGVRIVIFLNDHLPPHLHALFAGQEAKLSIATGEVLSGKLPRAKLKTIQTWLGANREEVAYIWREIRAGRYSGGMIA
ncbi:DUF4160 domain-containing protein [Methylobacterium sp. J-026]|uniref:DUF4160 domain-containing protein n=1 Tax=Methylobacterium sp. J-026 TaxID=2836624 RepID=UPI001FB87F90|nr:DUF4160 domain-containing protein [Methylobacterium sp. J-026]MCJ2134665.1 DUF4160 domain-containing protein [Methylobacterium sp. J-026]